MNKLILASQSPRRKEILSYLNIPFDIIPADIDEKINYENNLEEEIENLAYQKANYIFKSHQDKVVIGSDTIVVLDNEVIGKPKDEEDAINMLRNLQGRAHKVITGVAIISKEKTVKFHDVSTVFFNKMSEDEIREYVKTGIPMDKAGAYGIQGYGGRFIEKIDGDFYSIMGLPLVKVYENLKCYKGVL